MVLSELFDPNNRIYLVSEPSKWPESHCVNSATDFILAYMRLLYQEYWLGPLIFAFVFVKNIISLAQIDHVARKFEKNNNFQSLESYN